MRCHFKRNGRGEKGEREEKGKTRGKERKKGGVKPSMIY